MIVVAGLEPYAANICYCILRDLLLEWWLSLLDNKYF